jgi:hypothetical protein
VRSGIAPAGNLYAVHAAAASPLRCLAAAWPCSASLTLLALPACSPAALGAGGATTYEALRRADAAWRDLRTRRVWGPRPEFVRTTGQKLEAAPEVDVAVCGGTLGIFLACSLQQRGGRNLTCCKAAKLAMACPLYRFQRQSCICQACCWRAAQPVPSPG